MCLNNTLLHDDDTANGRDNPYILLSMTHLLIRKQYI